jgi:hypothetical protein
MSDVAGQSGHALPLRHRPVRAISGREQAQQSGEHLIGRRASIRRSLEDGRSRNSRNNDYSRGWRQPCGTQEVLYSNPFARKTVLAAGEVRNVTSAFAASAWLVPVTMPGENWV